MTVLTFCTRLIAHLLLLLLLLLWWWWCRCLFVPTKECWLLCGLGPSLHTSSDLHVDGGAMRLRYADAVNNAELSALTITCNDDDDGREIV